MYRKLILSIALSGIIASCSGTGEGLSKTSTSTLAQTPPMGWNSWICFGTSVTEAEIKANADFMAEHLKEFGWEYIVIDAGWYAPGMVSLSEYESHSPEQLIDPYGRLIADEEKYPSAAGGLGLKPLADYIHSKGLKLGIHIMRGIPIQAVQADSPILGTSYSAKDIAQTDSQCDWYYGFYGIDMSKPGAQEYYNSIFELYASWGIDYVKADDLLAPVYAADEIDAMASAVSRCGREMVLSLSPGPAPLENYRHMKKSAQLWRISEDFWDNWDSLKKQFDLCRKWQDYVTPGHWPDADMLPIGPMAKRAMRGEPRSTNFTKDEQYTLITLWSMFRSPLMIGCNMPEMDDFTLKLLTNRDVIEINRNSVNNRELFTDGDIVAWYAQSPDSESHYVAVFNLSDSKVSNYDFRMSHINCFGNPQVTDLWTGESMGCHDNNVSMSINAHGVRLFRLNF